ncbi:BON domain-containing protein [Steroidobacter sp. S1-65]|uniref:BON domain-containing protein n=1 Tax=Steroidobacter gossypii TaxID=2805490 RepID=A0ABS1WQN2_9GAMM|nr:BON domain-containing protein [Steroidobacter gossypii]MBM0103273.1 BON domain-containing protein [Steroidobacter gossypii]
MAAQNSWRDAPLSGDDLYGDRDNLRRYRDSARDEHRRFASLEDPDRSNRDRLVDYDDVPDFTGGESRPGRRHATEGGYAYGNYGGVTPTGRQYEGAGDVSINTPQPKHRGRGPRGYQRADRRIQEDICDRLTDDDRIDASDIDVKVENGEVTLSGTLRSRNAKRWAIQIAEQTSGVKDVHTSIRVSDPQTRAHGY